MAPWSQLQDGVAVGLAVPGRLLAEVGAAAALEDDHFAREADLATRETYRAELWSKSFLGLTHGNLCETMGFSKNTYGLLAAQMLSAFFALKLLMCLGRSLWVLEEQVVLEDEEGTSADQAIEELSRFSDMVENHLGTLKTQVYCSSEQQAADQTAATPAAAPAAPPGDPSWQQDVESLQAEVQQRVAGLKEKWVQEKVVTQSPQPQKEAADAVPEAWMAVLYLRGQAIITCVELLQLVVSISTVPHEHDPWSAYCLFVYGYANSGLLPTAMLGAAYLAGSTGNALFLVPGISDRSDNSYQPLPTDVAGPAVVSGKRPRRGNEEQVPRQVVILLVPLLLPLSCVAVTHVLPFFVMYIWVALIMLLITKGAMRFVQLCDPLLEWFGQLPAVTLFIPAQRSCRQAELACFIAHVSAGLFVLMSVMTMTRVYAGEFHHGGYLDQLLEHLVKDESVWVHSACPWLSVNRLIDSTLRWS